MPRYVPHQRALLISLLLASCSPVSPDAGGGTGGAPSDPGAGGGAVTGPATGSGGRAATGGSVGSGGVVGSGGASGSGGNASGGRATTGGSPATGGAAGGRTGGASMGGAPATGGATTDAAGCPIELTGWATVNGDGVANTTGGGNATPTTVTTLAALAAAAQDSQPRVIVVSGTIRTTDAGGFAMNIASNKTIMGANKSATIYGGINLSNVSNVIIRNLNVQGTYPNSGPDDTVASHGAHHIWYDHLAIWDSTDGSLDITNASNYQTVSWTKFWYTDPNHPHRLASLNGSGGGDHPEDSGKLKITYHHNWWADRVNERMPRVMYGQGHQYNNYFNSPGNLYCIGVGSFAADVIENNYFKGVNSPHIFMYALHAYIMSRGNVYDGTTGNQDTGLGGTDGPSGVNAAVPDAQPFTPPYAYKMDAATDVPGIVQRCAGPH